MKVDLVLSWPPSQGSYYAYNGRSKYVTEKGKAYQATISAEVFEQAVQGVMLEYPLEFSAIFYPPSKKVWDFDNHLKALQDTLTKCKVWEDDSAIAQMHCYEGVVVRGGRIVLRVEPGGPRIPSDLPGGSVWDYLG